jgi:hypothetical protein
LSRRDGFAVVSFPVVLASEISQQAHHIVVIFFRWCEAVDDLVEQIWIGTIEQSLEPVHLRGVEVSEMGVGKPAEDEIALLGSPMPASEQQPSAPDI